MDYRIFLWVACLSLGFWCSAEDKNTTVAGYVNEEVITKNDVYQLSKDTNLNYNQALNQLIEQHLLLQDFNDKKGRISSAQLDVQMDSIVQENFNGNRNALAQVLKTKGQTFFGLKEDVKTSIILNIMRQQKSQSVNNISPKKIKEYYQHHIDEFKVPARYYIEQSGFKETSNVPFENEEKNKVDVLNKLLEEKTSIAEIRKLLDEFTIEPIWYNALELDPVLIERLENTETGQSTGYLKINDVWIISKLLEKQTAQIKPLSEVQAEIEEKILSEINQKNYQAYIDCLKKKSVVKIFP